MLPRVLRRALGRGYPAADAPVEPPCRSSSRGIVKMSMKPCASCRLGVWVGRPSVGWAVNVCCVLSTVLTLRLSAPSGAEDLPLPRDADGWFVRTRAMAGVSHAAGEFSVLAPGATESEQVSADPQAYFGVGAGIGYRWQGWGIPLRAVLDGSLNFRHDTDVSAEFAGGLLAYENNLRVWDFRVSLLADLLRFRWGTVYVGGGIGAAHLESEVEIEAHPLVEESSEWKASPSIEAGIVFDGLFER